MQRLSGIVIPDESGVQAAQVAAIVGAATNGRRDGGRGLSRCRAVRRRRRQSHAAIVTGLSRQLLYIAFAARPRNKICFAPGSPNAGGSLVAPQQWRVCRRSTPREKVVHHEKIVQVIETSWM